MEKQKKKAVNTLQVGAFVLSSNRILTSCFVIETNFTQEKWEKRQNIQQYLVFSVPTFRLT